MKFLVEVGYVVRETTVSIHHDTPVMGAYETEVLKKNEYLCKSRSSATRKLNAIKQSYLAQGYRESSSRPNCFLHPILRLSEEIHLTTKEVELSRQRAKAQ